MDYIPSAVWIIQTGEDRNWINGEVYTIPCSMSLFFYLSLRSFDDASVRSSPTARARNRLLTKRLKGNGRGRKLADIALVGRVVFCCCLIQYKRRHSSMISHWKPSSRTNYQTTNDPYKQQGRFISSTPCGCVHRFSIFVFLAFPLLSIHKWPEHVRS